ncbi:hypothetical protein [Rhodococcus jostii]|uniref:hypothetical protein n=1 Tax=Rhodococcus jostii TaxID=132919 RepID=UPI003643B706
MSATNILTRPSERVLELRTALTEVVLGWDISTITDSDKATANAVFKALKQEGELPGVNETISNAIGFIGDLTAIIPGVDGPDFYKDTMMAYSSYKAEAE